MNRTSTGSSRGSDLLTFIILGMMAGFVGGEEGPLSSRSALQPGGSEMAAADEAARGEVIALWRGGQLTRDDLDRWSEVHGVVDREEALREMAYVVSMADATRLREGQDELPVRLALEAARQKVLVSAVREQLMEGVVVEEADLEALLEENPEALIRPRKMKLRHIYKRWDPGDPGARAATLERMAEIRSELLAGAEFEEVAGRESESQTKVRGGLVGFVASDELSPEVAAALEKLEVGELTPVIESGDGASILLFEEERPARTRTFEEVRETWRANLLKRRREIRWAEFEEGLLRDFNVRIDLSPVAEAALVMKGYRLEPSALESLKALHWPGRDLEAIDDEVLEGLLRRWALSVATVRWAEEAGLTEEPQIEEALRWRATEALARRELVRRVDARLSAPTEEELRQVFDRHARQFRSKTEVHLGMIHFGAVADREKPQEWVAEVLAVAESIESGELGFEEAARRYSVRDSAVRGGDEGWSSMRRVTGLGIQLGRILGDLEPGESSGVVRLESGLWLFELRDRRPPRPLEFEEVETRVRSLFREERIAALEGEIRRERLAEIDLRIERLPE